MLSWSDLSVTCEVIDIIEHEPLQPLSECTPLPKPATYLWTLEQNSTDIAGYDVLVDSGWPCYVGSAANLWTRVLRHRRNLRGIRLLSVEEISLAIVYLASHASAVYVEALLIDAYQPVFNQPWLSGLGSAHNQGRSRRSQRRSPFAELHGRTEACTGPSRLTRTELAARAEQHIAQHVRAVRAVRLTRPTRPVNATMSAVDEETAASSRPFALLGSGRRTV